MSSFIKHIILCLMFFTLFMMVAMVVFRVEDIFDASPREYLPPSMIIPFGSIQGFNMSAIKKIHGSIQGFNMSAIKNIQRRLHAYINTWQAVQVINPDVPKKKITFSNNRKKLIKLNQSESVSWHSKCALVGNAGILLDSGCGDVIDKFEFVIRMNLAPSGGEFKRDVGSKVNLMTLNQEQMERLISCTNSSYPPEWKCNNTDYTCLKKREAKYPSPREPSHCDDLLRRLERINGSTLWFFKRLKSVYFRAMQRMLGALKPNYNLSIKFAYSPTNPMGPASRAWKVGFPSSGLAVYSAATQFCQQITMLGFYPFSQDSRNRTLRYHYYEKRKMNYTTNEHGMPNEYRILTKLNRTGAINLINECK